MKNYIVKLLVKKKDSVYELFDFEVTTANVSDAICATVNIFCESKGIENNFILNSLQDNIYLNDYVITYLVYVKEYFNNDKLLIHNQYFQKVIKLINKNKLNIIIDKLGAIYFTSNNVFHIIIYRNNGIIECIDFFDDEENNIDYCDFDIK